VRNGFPRHAGELIAVMDRMNIRSMVNLTGGFGSGLTETIESTTGVIAIVLHFHRAMLLAAAGARLSADTGRGNRAGAQRRGAWAEDSQTLGFTCGIKLLRESGEDRTIRDSIRCGCVRQLNMPVAIHISDPLAFFTPTDRFNERFARADQSSGLVFLWTRLSSNAELIEARNRVIARHPGRLHCVARGQLAENWRKFREPGRFPNSMSTSRADRRIGTATRAARGFFESIKTGFFWNGCHASCRDIIRQQTVWRRAL